jgi:hypothetical protein
VDIIDARGRLTPGTPEPFTPIPVTRADRDAERARRASAGGPPGRRLLEDADFPATMGPFVGSGSPQVAPNGDVWILRAQAANDPTPRYDIWAGGRLVGKATLRPHSRVVGFGQGVVYVARQDPKDDLRYVEQYALR